MVQTSKREMGLKLSVSKKPSLRQSVKNLNLLSSLNSTVEKNPPLFK